MKYIEKGREPAAFSEWKALANENWRPTFGDLRGKEKAAVKDALMREQGFLCCYCERRLREGDSHIEHFRPQSDPAVEPLDFANLLCSCQSRTQKGEPLHCGRRKGEWFDPDLLISPLDPGCESRFGFTGDGGIHPASAEDAAAGRTIEKLGLDIPKLRDLRKKAIDPFLDEDLTTDELRRFVAGYLVEDAELLGEFYTAIHFLFGGLRDSAP